MTVLNVTRVRRRTVTDGIIEQITERVAAGALPSGSAVPNEMRLAEQLGVGRSSVREALKVLQAVGVLERSQVGTVVAPNARVAVLRHEFNTGLMARQLELVHLFEARRVVEGEITALAAARIDDASLTNLRDLEVAMRSLGTAKFEAYFLLDMQFHAIICEVADNPVFSRLWSVFHEVLLDSRHALDRTDGLLELSNSNHEKLLVALSERNPAAARSVVHVALQAVEDLVLKTLEYTSQEKELS